MPPGFEIKQKAAAGRLGVLETPHGRVATPTLLPVVNPNLNLVPPATMRTKFGAEMIITNSYILRQNAGLRERALRDGVHRTVGWEGPIMTDSGTFQSYMYGQVDVSPDEILDFQKRIGVDVGTILDVFTTPDKGHAEADQELHETLARARRAATNKDGMMLAATVQGGVHTDLRERAAQAIAALDADVAPIGGVVPLMEQAEYATLARIILAAKKHLPAGRPVHLFGAGHPLVFPLAAALGCDLFDSASYAKYAKDGRMMFPWGTRSLSELEAFPCACAACAAWASPSELRGAPDGQREQALAEHNLHVSFAEIRRIRQAIHDGALWELVEERAAQNPALLDALRVLEAPSAVEFLEAREPVSQHRALTYRGPHTFHRPHVWRLHRRLLESYRTRHHCVYVLPPRTTPYADAYAPYLHHVVEGKAAFVVDSPFGPVPLEADLFYPVAQSSIPDQLDEEAQRIRTRFADAFYARFEGCDILPFDATEHPAKREGLDATTRDAFDTLRARTVAELQLGPDAAEALLAGRVGFVRSPNNDRVRNVLVDREHAASWRAEDGRLTLRMAGARRLHAKLKPPRLRIRVETDAAAFVSTGKNVIAKTVMDVDAALRPGDEALVVDEADRLVAVARLVLAPIELTGTKRGVFARTSDHPAAS